MKWDLLNLNLVKMADKKQYFRDIKPGEVSIEGRQSNGITADNEGNVFIYSGLKDTELDFLSETQNKDNIPLYYGNSYVAISKSKTHANLNLGNNNYETLNKKTDANKITTTKKQTSSDNLYDPCLDLTTLSEEQKRKFILDVVDYVISAKGTKKKYTDIIPLDGGTVGRSHFATSGLDALYTAMGDAVVQKYFGNDKNGQPMTVKKMIKYYASSCLDAYPGNRKTNVRNDGEGCKYEYPKGTYDPTKDKCKRNWGCYTGGHNPLGIDWKEGMTKFLNDPANNVIQDNAVVKGRIDAVDLSIKKGWKTAFEWATAVGIDNSGGFATRAREGGWNAEKTMKAYVDNLPSDHRRERSELTYKYFPPCGGATVTSTSQPDKQAVLPPKQEETLPVAAPPPDDEEVTDFIFLEDQQFELSPTQLTDVIDTTNNNNEDLTIDDLTKEKEDEEEIRRREKKGGKTPTGNKIGSIKILIQNNSKEYGGLGDTIYHPTPLYSQSDSEWGSYTSTHTDSKGNKYTLRQSSHGCCYNTICMLLGNAIKDANKSTPYAIWNSGVKNTKSVLVYFDDLASVVGKDMELEDGSMTKIDQILKSKPVGFEWSSKKGWPKGYNLYKGTKKGKYKGDSKGISYTCCNQHWMVITGKNSDGTYTVFDPSGGIIRKNQSRDQIEAGLERIVYVN